MSEKNNKKQSNTVVGYLLIAAGLLNAGSSFIGEVPRSIFLIIKLTISVLAILYGLWMILKKK